MTLPPHLAEALEKAADTNLVSYASEDERKAFSLGAEWLFTHLSERAGKSLPSCMIGPNDPCDAFTALLVKCEALEAEVAILKQVTEGQHKRELIAIEERGDAVLRVNQLEAEVAELREHIKELNRDFKSRVRDGGEETNDP